MTPQQPSDPREIDLRDLAALIWRRRLPLLAATLFAAAVALAVSLLIRPVWQGGVVFQVGQVGQAGQAGQAGPQLVEPMPRAIERLSMKDFQDACLRDAGLSLDQEDPEAKLYRTSVTGTAVGSTDLVRLTVRGHSREAIARLLASTVKQLATAHGEIAAPTIRTLRSRLDHLNAELGSSREDLGRLRRLEDLRTSSREPERFLETVYLQGLIASKVVEIRAFEEQKLTLEEQLSPGRSYSTSIIDRVRVAPRPVSPHVIRNVVVTGLATLLLFLVVLLFVEVFRIRPDAVEEPGRLPGTGQPSPTPRALDRLG